ncbi:uncharacterized protein LOC119587049 [Penaeus monodon]|uniref:uncharacterized protein LOC119587049 n=1 Tax=Penaeus monodon TaxID=6687 RepID=UPI0018A7B8AC|nr:uncharacterized protein LOC119587049 [Penaeus monodon]
MYPRLEPKAIHLDLRLISRLALEEHLLQLKDLRLILNLARKDRRWHPGLSTGIQGSLEFQAGSQGVDVATHEASIDSSSETQGSSGEYQESFDDTQDLFSGLQIGSQGSDGDSHASFGAGIQTTNSGTTGLSQATSGAQDSTLGKEITFPEQVSGPGVSFEDFQQSSLGAQFPLDVQQVAVGSSFDDLSQSYLPPGEQ